MAFRIFLADSQRMFRQSVKALLEMEADFVIIGEASDGREAVRLATSLYPDLIILDRLMPLLNGLDAGREILRSAPATKIMLLSASFQLTYIYEALYMGVFAYVLKTSEPSVLVRAIREVVQGALYLDPVVASASLDVGLDGLGQGRDPLSLREREVLQLISEGRPSKEVATVLGISRKTADAHRQRIATKLKMTETAQLVRYAIRRGIIEA